MVCTKKGPAQPEKNPGDAPKKGEPGEVKIFPVRGSELLLRPLEN